MPTLLATIKSSPRARLSLTVADRNRARWAMAALTRAGQLSASLMAAIENHGSASVIDSITLLDKHTGLEPGMHIILWDGFNSYLELRHWRADLVGRSDIRYVVVGWLNDLNSSYPTPPIPLFEPQDGLATDDAPALPSGFMFAPWASHLSRLRTAVRSHKNAISDFRRHRQLCSVRKLVFCGLLRPSRSILPSLMRDAADARIEAAFADLAACPLDNRGRLLGQVDRAYQLIQAFERSTPERLAASYSLVSILHRVATISMVSSGDDNLFLSEFGRDRHFDPYDSTQYRQHLYLDFGSTRGVESIYPRTLDLQLHRKRCSSFRLIGSHAQFGAYLSSCSARQFLAQCEHHAGEARRAFRAAAS